MQIFFMVNRRIFLFIAKCDNLLDEINEWVKFWIDGYLEKEQNRFGSIELICYENSKYWISKI